MPLYDMKPFWRNFFLMPNFHLFLLLVLKAVLKPEQKVLKLEKGVTCQYALEYLRGHFHVFALLVLHALVTFLNNASYPNDLFRLSMGSLESPPVVVAHR